MPNDDYIKRSELIEHFNNFDPGYGLIDQREVVDDIRDFPAADVEPKRGTGWWIPGDYVAVEHGECVTYPVEGITCSCCHYGFKKRFLWSMDYCPHCGSLMLPEPPKEADDV